MITRTIGFLVYDDMQALDVTGPMDVFGSAMAVPLGRTPPYALRTIGLRREPVRAEHGLTFVPDTDIHTAPPLDTLLIPGGVAARVTLGNDAALLAWLRERARSTRRVVSICTGAYLLAAAGLLDGRRATTHWRFAADFAARYPRVRLEADRLYVGDGALHTSGGLTAGMDLALALVEADLGAQIALAVARDLVMYVKRPGNQTQFSAPLQGQMRGGGPLDGVVEWLLAHLDETLSIERVAEQFAMSPRHFRRVFVERFDVPPARYLERLRLERACVLLTGGNDSVERIAQAAGFASADAFRRVFRARYGASPGEYRQRFGMAGNV